MFFGFICGGVSLEELANEMCFSDRLFAIWSLVKLIRGTATAFLLKIVAG